MTPRHARSLGRAVALVSLLCLSVHIVGVAVMPHEPVLAIAMLLLAVGCAFCAASILRDGADRHELRAAVGFGAAMLVLHLGAQALGGLAAGHGHPVLAVAGAGVATAAGDAMMIVATSLSASQVLLGCAALIADRRAPAT